MTMRNNSLIGLPRLVAVTLTCQLPDWLNSLVTAGLAVVTSLPSENLNTYTRSFRLQRRPVNKNFLLYMHVKVNLFIYIYFTWMSLYLGFNMTLNHKLNSVYSRWEFKRWHLKKWRKYTLLCIFILVCCTYLRE